ncbi:hypothetical protein WN55_02525 [Dufourea novaeangliae]|uniref:Uncharacterized protein n=1 Tax=Dufourea novaeangliae TaxID=178035 RepID=A0A154PI46_DUFNO|nr:hypothetical protein WN55_02525 [Dufourea novaeangliae]
MYILMYNQSICINIHIYCNMRNASIVLDCGTFTINSTGTNRMHRCPRNHMNNIRSIRHQCSHRRHLGSCAAAKLLVGTPPMRRCNCTLPSTVHWHTDPCSCICNCSWVASNPCRSSTDKFHMDHQDRKAGRTIYTCFECLKLVSTVPYSTDPLNC